MSDVLLCSERCFGAALLLFSCNLSADTISPWDAGIVAYRWGQL